VLGHRGAAGAPENTLAAFARAAGQGADGIELDVRLCGSGEVVVMHDPDLARVTGGADRRRIDALTRNELTRVSLAGERVPTLAEVLGWARREGLMVNVEMKRDQPHRFRLPKAVARLLRKHAGSGDILVSSFDPFMLLALRARLLGVTTALLFGERHLHLRPWTLAALARFPAVNPKHTLVSKALVDRAHSRRQAVSSWTVNDPDEARRLASAGVDALITDEPAKILAALS
jgi:glycerophosphoryl diester phosphodiesterase